MPSMNVMKFKLASKISQGHQQELQYAVCHPQFDISALTAGLNEDREDMNNRQNDKYKRFFVDLGKVLRYQVMQFMNTMYKETKQSVTFYYDDGTTRICKPNIPVETSLAAPSASAKAESDVALLLMIPTLQQVLIWQVTWAFPSTYSLMLMARIRHSRLFFFVLKLLIWDCGV